MVKITQELIVKYASHTKQRTNESDSQYMKRITHIYFQERQIDEICNLSPCKNLSVLYLYDNNICLIKELDFAMHMTHLYLQKNNITKITGLNNLFGLTKLYLGQNCITVVEGLEQNKNLSELHIEDQKLDDGEKLLFDPNTLQSLKDNLTILNVSSNNIEDFEELRCLRNLSHLIAEKNKLTDMEDLSQALIQWPFLSKLNVSENPLCKKKKYIDKIIIMSSSLVMINGKEVSESNRQFLKSWYANKEAKKRQKRINGYSNSCDYVNTSSYTDGELRAPYSFDTFHRDSSYAVYSGNGLLNGKHLSKQHQQFVEVLARSNHSSNTLPPLDQINAK